MIKRSVATPCALAGVAVLVVVLAAAAPLLAQGVANLGQVQEKLHFTSAILGKDVNYAVYLPADYETSTRRYPVVYLLHGLTGSEIDWVQSGEVNLAADRAIAEREIPPMIIVMPNGGNTWYVNDYQNKIRYEDMFVQEFVPHIDATFRTRPSRDYRAISGLSMGGWGTLMFAMKHPDLFSSCAAFSAGIWTNDEFSAMNQEAYEMFVGAVFGPKLAGKDRLTPHFRKYSPLELAKSEPEASLKRVRFYIDCGDDDFLIGGNCALHLALRERKIPHEFRVRDGGHTFSYWRTGIVDGLKFIGQSFRH